MQELMQQGRTEITQTENTLTRAEKLIADTEQIGQQVSGGAGAGGCACVRRRKGKEGGGGWCGVRHGLALVRCEAWPGPGEA
jgi:hypothetical protein